MLYVTVMQGYRAIFRTKKDAVEAGLVDDVIEDCKAKGLVVLCDMDSKMRYHYFVGLPITEETCPHQIFSVDTHPEIGRGGNAILRKLI